MKIVNIYPIPSEICHQTPIYPVGMIQGGAETEATTFAESLADNGHKVVYFTGRYPGITVNKLKVNDNLSVEYLNLHFSKDNTLAFSYQLFFKLMLTNFDVIQTYQVPIFFALIGGLSAKIKRKRFIITFCGKLPLTKIQKSIAWLSQKLADSVVIQNNFTRGIVKQFVNEKKLVQIPYCIDTKFFRRKLSNKLINKYKTNNEFIILTISRLIPAKGVDVIIRAVYEIKNTYKINNIKLIISGTGPMINKLQQLVNQLGLLSNVQFTGYLNRSDLPYYYSLGNVFVLASTQYDLNGKKINEMCETFGLVLAEAMACGTPVIASKTGGIPDWIIDNYNGLLFNERDYRQLAKLIVSIIKEKKLAKNLVKNANIEISKKYSPKVVTMQYEKLYKGLN